ncbi:hypothetical protein N4219_09735 [Yersinia enterocolitica]|uniref:hypothetical protein n=1 Tax=Yersinia TaxID=629 RepID=UPI0005E8ACD7|nr:MULTISPECIES: hypothetical protein [Yersinia]ELY5205586.1 hypothetical protein [Yersinia enterocolitica]UYJ82732.1 hypothetical protein N4219_09735 [Yersinia enterocolitica]CFB70207.1 Uncharacterised protein [Yersinia enterocolitica]HDL8331453.1 hypothetical protein [Yersinia enterocolitica]HDM8455681.1 hypothetical protein [Yersinia enterocolitica]
MSRYRRVNIDGDSLFKTETRKTAAALYPGTLVVINGSKLFAQATTPVGRMYVLDNAYHEGLGITDQIPSGHSAIGNYLEEGREFAVRVAAGTYTKDQPITVVAGLAAAVPAAAGTYKIIGYCQDAVVTAAVDFIRIRVRADSVTVS